jgi:hypothetical protein
MFKKFHEWLRFREGGMVADDKAEEGKSKVKNPAVRGPGSVTTHGVAGGPGGYKGSGGGVAAGGIGAAPAPAAGAAPPALK